MEQQIVKRYQLTKVAFNPTLPILVVSDNRGVVYAVKLPDHLQGPSAGMDGDKECTQLLKALRVTKD
jgi:hypothetical protein